MVLESLSTALKETLKKIARSIFVDERLIDELVKDIQRALLSADVNVKLVFELTKTIKERALNEKPPKGIQQKEFIIKIVHDELAGLLGGEKSVIKIGKKPTKIMMLGLLGSGKTTSIGKLGNYYIKRGYKVAALGLDIHRPAAMDQLEQVSSQINIPCYIKKNEKNPLNIYNEFKEELKKYDIVLIDTAGRHALDSGLIREMEDLNSAIKPDERILVVSADLGQAAQQQAEQFHKSCSISGIIITKMDGTSKAGGALTSCAVTKAPVKFIGTGEKLDDIEEFNPTGFVGRLLGMGDLEALLQKARDAIDEETADNLGRKFLKGSFNFLDLYEQMQSLKKMGSLSKIVELIPGMGHANIPKDMLDVQDEKLRKWKFIMQSMTKHELEDPEILSRTRIERIAKGAGVNAGDVRDLLKQYRQSKKLVKMMGNIDEEPDMNKLMRKFKDKMPKGFKFGF